MPDWPRRERTHGRGFSTRAIHVGERPDPVTHAHNTPIYATASPFASWLGLRGVRSIPLRSRAASANAVRLATFLEAQPKVEWVRYPGLASHPDHAVASRLIDGPGGGMLTFRMHGGIAAMAAFTDNLQLCDIGVSLGDICTLVYPQPKRDGLVRVSVGCEDVDDLIEDFTRGLAFVPSPA